MPEPPFSNLYRETARLVLPDVAHIQRRARKRAIRRRFATGTAAAAASLALIGAAVAYGGGTDPTPGPPSGSVSATAPSASAAPSTTSSTGGPTSGTGSAGSAPPAALARVPVEAMLRPADAGPGSWQVKDETAGDWALAADFRYCLASGADRHVAGVDRRERNLSAGAGTYTDQLVDAYRIGDAERYLAQIRTSVRACARFGDNTMRMVGSGFAGPDSFLVETGTVTGDPAQRRWHAFVRRGNLVTEVVPNPPGEASARQFGQRAAARLCTVTATC